MAIIKYKDSAGNWQDLIYTEGGGGDTIYIGSVNMVNSDGLLDTADATNTITYKPDFDTAMNGNHKPMAFESSYLGNGNCHGYIFYNYYETWDYFSKTFDIYFYTHTDSGATKAVRLHYQYDEADTSKPQSITAYLI